MTLFTAVREIVAETLRLQREIMRRYPEVAFEN